MVQDSPFERDFDDFARRLFTRPFARMTSPPRMADLFCGIGGAYVAASQLGIDVVWAAEEDPEARQVYQYHTQIKTHSEISGAAVAEAPQFNILYAAIRESPGGVDALTTPAQPFPRIVQMLRKGRPPGVVLEAPRETGAVARGRVLAGMIAALDGLGYEADWRLLDMAGFAGEHHPAASWISDERLYVIGIPSGYSFEWPDTEEIGTSSGLLVPPLSGVSASETLRLYGFPSDWTLPSPAERAERLIGLASPVPVARALLEAVVRASPGPP